MQSDRKGTLNHINFTARPVLNVCLHFVGQGWNHSPHCVLCLLDARVDLGPKEVCLFCREATYNFLQHFDLLLFDLVTLSPKNKRSAQGQPKIKQLMDQIKRDEIFNIISYKYFTRLKMKALLSLFLFLAAVLALDNGLAKTPPMGWNSWNRFGCSIDEKLIKETADLMVSTGLAAKGYKFINLDDCWQISRNATTKQIIEDKIKFPSGMAALGEYIHSKGLLFGLYSDAGYKTCAGRPGSLGYETQDANTYAKWKVDYLKYDNCNTDGSSTKTRYPVMRDALNKTGRPIFYSMCSWGVEEPWIWARPVGNSWRTTGDISSTYKSFVEILDKQVGLSKYASPGGWNDPDMLEVGNGQMTNDEYQAHFALWAALKSPLLIGCGLTGILPQTLAILGNEEVIAVNQDPLGMPADLILNEKSATFERQVWGSALSNNRFVYVCFNRHSDSTTFKLDFSVLLPTQKIVGIRQIIDKVDVTVPQQSVFVSKTVRTHAVAMYIIKYQ